MKPNPDPDNAPREILVKLPPNNRVVPEFTPDDFEEQAYPHLPPETRAWLKGLRPVIRAFFASPMGKESHE